MNRSISIWPDRVLAFGSFLLWAALLPTLHHGPYPASGTAALTAAVLGSFVWAQTKLELYKAAGMTAAAAFTWGLIFLEAVSA